MVLNDFRTGDLLDYHHGGVVRRCRVISPPWSDNTGVVVEIELPDGRVVRCHDTDLRFPSPAATGTPSAGTGTPTDPGSPARKV